MGTERSVRAAARLLVIAWALGTAGVPPRTEGGGGHPPPSVAPGELAETELVLADPKSTPTQQVHAIGSVTFRPAGLVARPLRTFLEAIAKDERRALPVRLDAAQGFCFGFRDDAAPMRKLLRKLEAQAAESHDPLTVVVLTDALHNGSVLRWPWLARDGQSSEENRSIARRAISHEAIELRKAGLRSLAGLGVAADADVVRPLLSSPLRDEFYTALQVVWHNAAIAGSLRDVVWQIVSSTVLVDTYRVTALHALQAPWGEEELAVAERLLHRGPFSCYTDIALGILLRASAEDAAKSLVAVAGEHDLAKLHVLYALSSALENRIGSYYPREEREAARAKALAVLRVPALAQAYAEWAIAAEGDPELYRSRRASPLTVARDIYCLNSWLDTETRRRLVPHIAKGLESNNPYVVRRAFKILNDKRMPLTPILSLLRELGKSPNALASDRASALLKQAEAAGSGRPR